MTEKTDENTTIQEKRQLVEDGLELLYKVLTFAEDVDKATSNLPNPKLTMARTILNDLSVQINPDCNGRDADMQVSALHDEFLCQMR